MTGELCDCYLSKDQGVNAILDAVETVAEDWPIEVWSTEGCFVSLCEARQKTLAVAAGNWHVLATYVAQLDPQSSTLLVDMGSTTTDLIPLRDGQVCAKGLTDTGRLEHGELIYLGATRTPLMALGPTVGQMPIMAEHFATMLDVAVLLGKIAEDAADGQTADKQPRTKEASARRLLRMVGGDLDSMSITQAEQLAWQFFKQAVSRLADGIQKHTFDQIVLSGSGAFLAREAMGEMPVVDLASQIGTEASASACAFALCQV